MKKRKVERKKEINKELVIERKKARNKIAVYVIIWHSSWTIVEREYQNLCALLSYYHIRQYKNTESCTEIIHVEFM